MKALYRIKYEYDDTGAEKRGTTTLLDQFNTRVEAEAAMIQERDGRARERLPATRGGLGSVWRVEEVSVARRLGGYALMAALTVGVLTFIGFFVHGNMQERSHKPSQEPNLADRTVLQRLDRYDQTHGTDLMGLCGVFLNATRNHGGFSAGDVATLCTDLLDNGYVSDAEYMRLSLECIDAHGGDDKPCRDLPVKSGGTRGSAGAINTAAIKRAVRVFCDDHPNSEVKACRKDPIKKE
jgi:hypothetical protein